MWLQKKYSTQHALLSLLENWKKSIGNKGFLGGDLMDLSKAFDTLNYELLIVKLHAYEFGKESLMLLSSYLSNCWQRTKINATSVLGPLLFNIYLNDLFFFLDCNVWNFADCTTSFICYKNLDFVLSELERNSNIAIYCFQNNYMKIILISVICLGGS